MSLRSFLSRAPLALALAALFMTAPAVAHDDHKNRQQREPRLTLQAQAVAEIPQDEVEMTLAAELEGAEQADVSRRLTRLVNDTLAAARKAATADVTVRTGSYRLWPSTDRDGKITAWRGRAEIVLESTDLPAASELASKVAGDHMAIAGVAFSLSREARAAEEKRLLGEAAEAFRTRADEAASAFGFEGYRIRNLDLSGSGAVYAQHQQMGMMRAMGAADTGAPPLQFEAGTATVTVSVQGEVTLLESGQAGLGVRAKVD